MNEASGFSHDREREDQMSDMQIVNPRLEMHFVSI